MAKRAVVLVLLLLLGTAGTATASSAQVDVTLGVNAVVVQGGAAVGVPVRARCPQGQSVLEALVTVNQAGNEGTGFFQLPCDGKWHTTEAQVNAIDFLFQAGQATSSAFLLVLDPATGNTAQAQDGRTIRLR
jgi:hypothetical protein